MKKAAQKVLKRAKRLGVKMSSPARGRDSAMLPPLPLAFREAVADYLKVKPSDAVVVLSKKDQRDMKLAQQAVDRAKRRPLKR